MAPIVIGTRATPLALIQARIVARRLGDLGVETTVRPMSTQGDRSLGGSFVQSRGVFTGELAAALRDGSVDLVVHSLKDLPVEDEPGLVIAAVPERERPCDLLLLAPGAVQAAASDAIGTPSTLLDDEPSAAGAEGNASEQASAPAEARPLSALLDAEAGSGGISGLDAAGMDAVAAAPANHAPAATPARDAFAALPSAARLGTSSPRRQAAALALRADLVCCAVRGSVGRRMEWLASGAIDALLAAEAGLQRLAADGQLDHAGRDLRAFRLDLRSWPCAPGQGALAVQILRGGRLDGHQAMAALDHAPSRAAAMAERALLGRLGGGCLRPFGAWVDVTSTDPGSADTDSTDAGLGAPALRAAHAQIAPDDWRRPAALGMAPTAVRVAATDDSPGEIDLDDVARRIERRLARAADAAAATGLGAVNVPGQAAPDPALDAATADQPDLIVTSAPETARRLAAGLDASLRIAALPATKLDTFDVPWPVEAIDLDQPRRHWPWLLISSPTAARVVAERAAREPAWGRLPWCALGEGTARRLLAAGTPPNLAARAANGREFAAFAARVLDPSCRLLVPHSARGGESLIEALQAAGRSVTAWPAYTVSSRQDLAWPRGWQAARSVVLFTAPSAVAAFAASQLPWPGVTWAIGTATLAALESAGVANVKCATQPTAAGVARLWHDTHPGMTGER